MTVKIYVCVFVRLWSRRYWVLWHCTVWWLIARKSLPDVLRHVAEWICGWMWVCNLIFISKRKLKCGFLYIKVLFLTVTFWLVHYVWPQHTVRFQMKVLCKKYIHQSRKLSFFFLFFFVHFYCTVNENIQKKTPAMNNRNNKTLYGQIKLVVCVYKFIQYMQVCSHFPHLCVKRSVYDQTQ